MKLDKKQIPQLIILGLLVVGCIGYVSFTLAKPPAPAAPPASSKTPTAAVAEVTAQPQLAQFGTFPSLTAPIARRDPFVVQSLGTAHAAATSESNPRQTVPMPALPKGGFGKVPPLFPFGSSSAGSAPKLTVVPTVQPDPAFALTGVIRGDRNVAIIRVGATERHIVSEGQTIDGRYRVLSVTEDGAVLACKDRRIHLKLGGVRNGS